MFSFRIPEIQATLDDLQIVLSRVIMNISDRRQVDCLCEVISLLFYAMVKFTEANKDKKKTEADERIQNLLSDKLNRHWNVRYHSEFFGSSFGSYDQSINLLGQHVKSEIEVITFFFQNYHVHIFCL